MSQSIRIKVIEAELFCPFHDTTEGKEYDALKLDAGEDLHDAMPDVYPKGSILPTAALVFTDDVGDIVDADFAECLGENFEIVE